MTAKVLLSILHLHLHLFFPYYPPTAPTTLVFGIICIPALNVFESIKVTRSSLLPTAMVLPSGDQQMLMFSPLVLMVVTHLCDLESHSLTVLSPEAVASRSGLDGCQPSWSTESVCPEDTRQLYIVHIGKYMLITMQPLQQLDIGCCINFDLW